MESGFPVPFFRTGRGLVPTNSRDGESLSLRNSFMAFVYILFSPSRQRTYVGCSENWQERLETHNAGRVSATCGGIPWHLVHLEETDSLVLARRRETYLKTSAGRRWMKGILGNLADGIRVPRPVLQKGTRPRPDE